MANLKLSIFRNFYLPHDQFVLFFLSPKFHVWTNQSILSNIIHAYVYAAENLCIKQYVRREVEEKSGDRIEYICNITYHMMTKLCQSKNKSDRDWKVFWLTFPIFVYAKIERM